MTDETPPLYCENRETLIKLVSGLNSWRLAKDNAPSEFSWHAHGPDNAMLSHYRHESRVRLVVGDRDSYLGIAGKTPLATRIRATMSRLSRAARKQAERIAARSKAIDERLVGLEKARAILLGWGIATDPIDRFEWEIPLPGRGDLAVRWRREGLVLMARGSALGCGTERVREAIRAIQALDETPDVR